MSKINLSISLLIISIFFSCTTQMQESIPDKSFNKNWLFSKGDIQDGASPNLDDSKWRQLDVPHDWAIEGPFDKKYNARTGGLPVHGIAWYRKHFTIAEEHKEKLVSVAFDGAMNNSEVYINGTLVGERPFGYMGFEVDLTPHIKFGAENVIAVKLSPEDLASRWYSGAGIYRNVYLKINNPIHVPQWGTFITTPTIKENFAKINIETTVRISQVLEGKFKLEHTVLDENGDVASFDYKTLTIPGIGDTAINAEIEINKPVLWDLENPHLYTVKTSIKQGETVIDEFTSEFGIRSIDFSAKTGFTLNGKTIEFQGVCMHHDLGALGAAVNYRATERQMEVMKSMGVNALRTSHNPPSPEMLAVCDKLGILVIDEAFDEWKIGKVINGYNKYFDEWHERDLRDMIKRDRNHPSVIMWSIGNEIKEQGQKDGWKLAKKLNDICHDEDNTRPTTAGFNNFNGAFNNKLAEQIDIVGLNYWPYHYKEAVTENPDMILYGSETSSQTSSRGVYHLPLSPEVNKESLHVSSYDVIVGPPWAYPPDVEFDVQAENPTFLGEFMWTGFDYLGEPTPYGGRDNSTDGYWNADWPSKSSYFAPVDLCGFPKDRYYLYQSQWTEQPMVHVLPHWNWEGKEGQIIPVYAYSNCEEVELFVNGESYGKKVKGKDLTNIPAEFHRFEKGTYASKYRLSWEVPYVPGSLKVVGYIDGKAVSEKEIKTAGKPAKITLEVSNDIIKADGKDLAFVKVTIVDNQGNFCPLANNNINFNVEGEGSIAAVGNGDQASLASFQANHRKAFNGLCQLIIKSTEVAGAINITASSEDLEQSKLTIKTN